MSRRAAAIWALAPAFAAAFVFSGTLSFDFALDDIPLVRDNPAIRELSSVPSLFSEPYWVTPGESYGLYRPVTVASLSINRALTGDGPMGFHAGNVLLHALASALVWFLARRLGTHYGTALAASLLFAVHPLRVEAVANIAGRAELLAATGVFASWLCHRRGVESAGRARPRWFAASGLLWLAAVLSKESAALAPLLFALDDRMRSGKPVPERAAPPAAWMGYVFAGMVALILRVLALGSLGGPASTVYLDNPAAFEGGAVRVATALWVHARYLGLLVWPSTLSSDYSYDAIPIVESWADPRLAIGIVSALAVVIAFGLSWRRGWRTLGVALACWALFLIPASNLLFASGTAMGERLTYLPSFGAFLLMGHALASLGTVGTSPGRSRIRPVLAVGLAGAILAGASVRSARRIPAWRDNFTLATTDVRSYPRSAKLQAGAGMFLAERERYVEAEEHLRNAVSIWPEYAQARFNLAVVLLRRRSFGEAVEQLVEAHALAPGNPNPLRLLDSLIAAAPREDEIARTIETLSMRRDLPPAVRELIGSSGVGVQTSTDR